MTSDEHVELSIRQFQGAWERICSGFPDASGASREGLELIFSGVPIPFFNVALLTGERLSAAELASRAGEAREWAESRQVPWFLVVTHERLAPDVDANAVLARAGLVPLLPLTGMLGASIERATRETSGLELLRPDDDDGCGAILDVNSAAYGVELDAAKPVLGTRSFWEREYPVLGRAGGEPATSAAVWMVDGHRYVGLVATLPTCQRRGFAEAAMRRALELAEEDYGPRPSFLHATEAGRPVYERMGYAALSSHALYIEQRFLPPSP